MKLIHEFEELPQDRRPQDPNMDGSGLRFETLEHGGEYPSFCLRLATRFPSTSGTAKHLAIGAGGHKRNGTNSP